MKYSCLICGEMHEEVVGNDVLLAHLSQATELIFKNLKKREEFSNVQSPICRECLKDWVVFLKYEGPMVAARFLQFIAEKTIKSRAIRMALDRRKQDGMKLGRPRTVTKEMVEKIVAMKKQGMTYRMIAREMKTNHGTIHKILKGCDGYASYASELKSEGPISVSSS